MPLDLGKIHREAQLMLRANALQDLLRIFPALDFNNLDKTWPAVEAALLLLVKAHGQSSSGMAQAFYKKIRKELGAEGNPTPQMMGVFADEILAGLNLVGPIYAKKQAARLVPIEKIRETTLVNLSGEVTRGVLNAGRATLLASLVADKATKGVRRVTSGDPCTWCAEQASGTYRATDPFPAHAHCACFPEPIF